MAKKKKQKIQNKRQVFLAFVGIAIGCVVMYSAIVLRDYNITADGFRLELEAKYPVPMVSSFTLNNQVPKKLSIQANKVVGIEVYEFRVSRFKNMAFAQTYKTANGIKDLGMMSGGKKYYIQARGYKNNNSGRSVHGKWSMIREITVKKSV